MTSRARKLSIVGAGIRMTLAVVVAVGLAVGLVSCSGASTPTSPSARASSPVSLSGGSSLGSTAIGASDVTFPPRNEPFDFRQQLESKYRDGLRRGQTTSFVDIEGDIVWVQEYLRYRLNACNHFTAVQKVMDQIDGRGIQPVCGTSAAGTVPFPPRNEPFDFRQQLEAKYRDGLRRGASTTFVDIEGDIVWVQEYVRYRVNGCGHADAVQKVLSQIDGGGIAPTCASNTPPARPVARFSYSQLPGATAGTNQCRVESASTFNVIRCQFDARASSGATDYRWTFPGNTVLTGSLQQDVQVPCASFGNTGGATDRPVTLTVTGPGGSDTQSVTITFFKASFC
jgi:hypothetical protein